MLKATFVTAASPQIGGGHVLRCLALANAFRGLGIESRFATDRLTRETVALLGASPFTVIEVPPADAHRHAMARDTDVVVFDGYAFDRVVEEAWQPFAKLRLVIDDLANRPHACDVLVDHAAGTEAAEYAGLVPAGCTVLAGPTYALLRPEFLAMRPGALARRAAALPRRVMIAMGLTDVGGITRRTVEGVRHAGLGFEIDVVTGRTAISLPWLRVEAGAGALRLNVDIEAATMAGLMAKADIAVGAGGGTSLERCCVGLPSLVILLADNQRPGVSSLVQAGAVTLIGTLEEATPERIAASLAALARDRTGLEAQARAAAAVVDGEGANRVCRVMLDRLAAGG
jgi:UDP-2,4-diacetamido-2,4,6-trideoxy-beta-L-altropyranose hydrolase